MMEGARSKPTRPKLFDLPPVAAKNPARRCRAASARPSVHRRLRFNGAKTRLVFLPFPSPSCGCGSCGTSSRDFPRRKTSPNRRGGQPRGQRPSPSRAGRAARTHGRTALASAAPAAARSAISAWRTSSATTWTPLRAGRALPVDADHSSHHSRARSNQDADMAEGASCSRAITSAQKQEPTPAITLLACFAAQAHWLRLKSIFTIVVCPQRLHFRGTFRITMPRFAPYWSTPRPQTGQRTFSSLTISVSLFFSLFNCFPPFIRKYAVGYKSNQS